MVTVPIFRIFDSVQTQAVWTWGTRVAVLFALIASLSAYILAHYPYFAATLDFERVDSGEPDHSMYGWDEFTRHEDNAAFVVLLVDSHFILIPMLSWAFFYGYIGMRKLLVYRHYLVAAVMILCSLLPSTVFFLIWGNSASRIEGFYSKEYFRLIERGTAIIQALDSFRTDYGEYPTELEQLVPRYLPEVPMAGIRICPEFNYIRSDDLESQGDRDIRVLTYEISVSMHKYRSHFADVKKYYLYYRPERDYPTSHEQIGLWAIEYKEWVRPA